jgi:DNA-binding protein YbaB
VAEEYKKRRILQRDFDKIEEFVNDEYDSRKNAQFRKDAEERWKEVDRQISMKPLQRLDNNNKPIKGDWRNAIELGELSKASEIITADIMRIALGSENYFECHVELEGQLDQNGQKTVPSELQEQADGLLRALMLQQQKDFGFKARFKLSVKESLHHGSFVSEIRREEQMLSQGAKIKTVSAPVWVPYSMWNAYPDPSPSIVGTNLFYTGSMILVDFMPLWRLKRMKSDGWIPNQISKVKTETNKNGENETEDIKLVKYIGDIVIERQDGDIYLPNMTAIIGNGKLVYIKVNDLAYPNVIHAGYERQDVRDPYYTSPIIKQSPMQKFTTVMCNRFADAVDLRTTPPVEYDGNDPDYVVNGGPDLSPGSKNPTKSMGKGFKTLEVGEPAQALAAMQFGFRQMQEGLGVSSLRQGTSTSDRQTATEAKLMEAGSEVRTIDFNGTLEQQALRPFLYLQHAWNREKFDNYEAYSNEMKTPDIVRFTKKDVDVNAHFDVVGSKGILGEKERQQNIGNVMVFLTGNPIFAPVVAKNAQRIASDMLRDAGKKNPEEWTSGEGTEIPSQVKAQMQQMQQVIQELSQKLQQSESGNQAAMAQVQSNFQIAMKELAADQQTAMQEQATERRQQLMDAAFERWKAKLDAVTKLKVAKITADARPSAVQQ